MFYQILYEKRDANIVASTGFGKSLIYQFIPVYLNKIAFVVSPLISLMQDQTLSLTAKGIKAVLLGSNQDDKTVIDRFHEYNIIYITPEYLDLDHIKKRITKVKDKICLFAIDESHCIPLWNSFR